MKILLTGASGFLGKHIYDELSNGNEIITMSRAGAAINVDLALVQPELPKVDLIIHAAGKAHFVPKSAIEKQAFFDVNLTGTLNLLKGLQKASGLPQYFVFISTVAVYGCDSGIMINETHPLNAKDPYGQSKIQAEHLIENWCLKNNVICTILRLPLLVGENAPGNLRSMISGIKRGYYFNIAGGKAKKSMVFAVDVAKIIAFLAKIGGVYNLTDGCHPSFSELSIAIAKQFGKNKPPDMPLWFAKLIATAGNFLGNNAPLNSSKLDKIISDLTFDDSKARNVVNWKPINIVDNLKI